jgi:hypothetical protein
MFSKQFSAAQQPETFAPAGRENSTGASGKSKALPGNLSSGEQVNTRVQKNVKKTRRTGEPNAQLHNNDAFRAGRYIADDDFRE